MSPTISSRNPLTAVKWDFLKSVLVAGTPGGHLAPQLQRWLGELQRPTVLGGYGRLINRFKLSTTVEFSSPDVALDVRGNGFIRMCYKQRNAELESAKARGVVEVVASFAEGLAWAQRRTAHGRLFATERCEMRVGRFGNSRLDKLPGVEKVRELLLKAGVVLEGKNQPALSGGGGREGFWFRCGVNWGYSPVAMFLSLTAFKLAMLEPGLVPSADGSPTVKLLRFYGWYKGLDDDARLAHGIVARGLHLDKDRKLDLISGWPVATTAAPMVSWPSYVGYLKEPARESVTVILELLQGKAPELKISTPTVAHMKSTPPGFASLGKQGHLPFTKSCNDVLLSGHLEVFVEGRKPYAMQIPKGSGDSAAVARVLGGVVTSANHPYIIIGADWLEKTPGAAKRVRKALLMLKGVTTFREFEKNKLTAKRVEVAAPVATKANKRVLFRGE